ncbi:MAG: methyltransferase domain-containing protein [Chloroflexi bacterium]|nr:methyltransferase domain-containing protein [Chloroflexota bacterium]
MHGERSTPPESDETDRLWVQPDAVLGRYGEQGYARQDGPSIYSFRQPPLDPGYAMDNLAWSGTEIVLDAGCGTGAYLPHIVRHLGPRGRVVGLDFTLAQLRMAREQEPAAVFLMGDVQLLPFADDSFDVALSAHMLYHVSDIRAAIREFRRVLRPSGVLAIIVGSARDQEELDGLFIAAGGALPLARYSNLFSSDNTPLYLDGIFRSVDLRVVTPQLVITDPEAVTTYFRSMRVMAEASLRPDVTWESMIVEARRIAAEVTAREGAFRVSEEIAMFLCR